MEITSDHKPIQRIVFMGTPIFATYSLQALNLAGYRPVLVITQPDAPRGRNLKLAPPPVKELALEMGIDIIQPEQVNSEEVVNILKQLAPDIIVTVAYGGYIGRTIRILPELGSINLHPSLLPKYRGPSPIHAALLNGDSMTGNTIYRLTSKIDAGPIYLQETYPIMPGHNLTFLEYDLAVQGADLLVKSLKMIENSEITEVPQDNCLATYTTKIDSTTEIIDWNSSAQEIYNRIRSLSFEPGAVTSFRGKPLKIYASLVTDTASELTPGSVVCIEKHKGIVISTKDKDILVTSVQPSGKKIMEAYIFHLGARIEKGEQFG
jgi:methionyl-tRNA formyltransferase